MTRDLEETLYELGPGYREVVDRLKGAYEPVDAVSHSLTADAVSHSLTADAASRRVPVDAVSHRVKQCESSALHLHLFSPPSSPGHLFRWTAAYLVAASLLVFLGLGVLFRLDIQHVRHRMGVSEAKLIYTVAYAADESALQTIVASQRADGSWANDFITRQNAAALRSATDAASLVAYKRALRYLRSRGLEPLTDDELKARADRAARARTENC